MQVLVSIYPVITVFYRVIPGFLTFCSETKVIWPYRVLFGLNYRYRSLPPGLSVYQFHKEVVQTIIGLSYAKIFLGEDKDDDSDNKSSDESNVDDSDGEGSN